MAKIQKEGSLDETLNFIHKKGLLVTKYQKRNCILPNISQIGMKIFVQISYFWDKCIAFDR